MASSYGRNGPRSASASRQRKVSTFGVRSAAATATSALAADVMNNRASQSSTM
jgi:hypothetical protein